jgi:hypothetical protein
MFYTHFHSTLFNNRRNSVLFPEFMGFGYLVANQLINMDGTTVQHTNYVIDYTSLFGDVIMAAEKGPDALTYRYTYGLSRNSVTITAESKSAETLYWHTDRLNSGRFLTDKLGNVASWTDYDAWGHTIGVKPMYSEKRPVT